MCACVYVLMAYLPKWSPCLASSDLLSPLWLSNDKSKILKLFNNHSTAFVWAHPIGTAESL